MIRELSPGAQGPSEQDVAWMRRALDQADLAMATGDVPVGAIVVAEDGAILGAGRNRREATKDPTAHAELEAIRAASRVTGDWRLGRATLFATLEPCPMCAGAALNARIARVVYGCADPKAGGVSSLFCLGADPRLNHRFQVDGGVLRDACARRLQLFFALLRAAGEK